MLFTRSFKTKRFLRVGSEALVSIIFFTVLFAFSCVAESQVSSPGTDPKKGIVTSEGQKITWLGVEVVGDSKTEADRVRQIVELTPGEILPFPNEPRYKLWCDTLRKEFSPKHVSCAPVIMEGAHAYYVVELTNDDARPFVLKCSPDASGLSADLLSLDTEFMTLLQTSLMKSDQQYREFLNDARFLDYSNPSLHEFAAKANRLVATNSAAVVSASANCDPHVRASAIQLMNWSGSPSKNISVAVGNILDPDEGVRNNATRLLGVYAKFIQEDGTTQRVSESLCAQLAIPTFVDRNKAANALLALVDQHPAAGKYVQKTCGNRIADIAHSGISIAPQIQGTAADLMRLLTAPAK